MELSEATHKMQAYIELFPSNLKEAHRIGSESIKSFNTKNINSVLIVGLGGSGIGGRICKDLVYDNCKVPINIINNYDIPSYVNEQSLVIAVSYSGNTEETLNAYHQAKTAGANITVISSGGKISDLARENGNNLITIPGGQPPRTSFGFNAPQLIFILESYGLLNQNFSNGLISASEFLVKEKQSIHALAKKSATHLLGKTPVIYTPSNLEGIGIRLRQQINENAKLLCWHHVLPEMNHNELVGWAIPNHEIAVIFLTSEDDHPKTEIRRSLTKEIIETKTNSILELRALGSTKIERAYYLIHLGDWISFYLAEALKVDPIEISVIDYLKSQLADRE